MAQHDDYQDEEFYEEDFPEGYDELDAAPAPAPAKKPSPTIVAAGVLGVLAVTGGATYVFAPDTLAALNPLAMLPPEVSALIPGMGSEETPPAEPAAPPEAVAEQPKPAEDAAAPAEQPAADEQKPADPAQPADAPVATAEKPAATEQPAPAAQPADTKGEPAAAAAAPAKAKTPNDGWTDATPAQKPKKIAHPAAAPEAKPAPVAAKPHAPKRVAVADAAGGRKKAAEAPVTAASTTLRLSTDVRFAQSSFWVSAAEMERLWSFSSRIKDPSGQLTVVGYAGNEGGMFSQAELSRKRAARVAELLQKNNPQVRFKVSVKTSTAGSRHVQVTYSNAL